MNPVLHAVPGALFRRLAALLGCGVLLAVFLAAARPAQAALTIEIVGSGERQIPVAIAPLPGEAGTDGAWKAFSIGAPRKLVVPGRK